MRTNAVLGSWLLAGCLVLVACGGDENAVDAGDGDGDGVRTGPGISADTITLGVLSDNSGPFKSLGGNLRVGQELWVEEVNAAGGICGRQIALDVRDHGFKAEQAKVQFPDLEPKVAGILELLGSSMIAALKGDIADRQLTTAALAFTSFLLDQPYVLIAGTTYDLELINGLAFLLEEGMLSPGDTIADIYIDGEGGANGLLGAQFMAAEHDLKLVEKKITATDADLTNVITGLKGEGVKAIVMTTTPAQTASIASANKALNLNVPMIANSPSFDPILLDGPAAGAMDKLYVVASSVPYSSEEPRAAQIAAAFETDASRRPSNAVQYGYALGLIWQQILEKACQSKDLSRAGIFAAKNASTSITTENLVPDLDFSTPGAPTTRGVYVAVVDKAAKGGLTQVKPLFVSEEAASYRAPHEK
ncbi:MAG: ABC transporter substrate-binding protein [Sporichthyaceae bacterium]